MVWCNKIYEGKVKIFYEGLELGIIVQYFKDDVIVFNVEKKVVIDGKGVLNNCLFEFFMIGLQIVGILIYFFKCLNMCEQLVCQVEVVFFEVIVCNFVVGLMVKCFGLEEGVQLLCLIVEFFYKDDLFGDLLVFEEYIVVFGWVIQQEMDEIVLMVLCVNDFFVGVMYGVGICLIDFKIEIGCVWENDFQCLVVVDEISFDSCCLWDIEIGQKLDKDVFCCDFGNFVDVYIEVVCCLGVLFVNVIFVLKLMLIN